MLEQILLGTLGILVGLAVCFYGYAVFRLLLPVLGFLFGVMIGRSLFPENPVFGWVIGIGLALLFAWIAYAAWSVLIGLGGAFLGFALGVSLGEWLHLWDWLSVVIGVVIAAGVGVLFFLAKDLMVMLITGLAGAAAIFSGLAYFMPTIFGWLGNEANWLTFILTIVLGLLGFGVQMAVFAGQRMYSEPPPGGPPLVPASPTKPAG